MTVQVSKNLGLCDKIPAQVMVIAWPLHISIFYLPLTGNHKNPETAKDMLHMGYTRKKMMNYCCYN